MSLKQDETRNKDANNSVIPDQHADALWRAFTQHSPSHVLVMDLKGTILSINHTVAGLSIDGVVGTSVYDYLDQGTADTLRTNIETILAHGKPNNFENTYIDPTGTTHIFGIRIYPVIEAEQTIALVINARDITQFKAQQDKLEQNLLLFNTIVAQAPIIIWSIDNSGIFTLSEGRALTKLGLKPGQVIGQSVFDVYKDSPEIIQAHRKALQGEMVTNITHINGRSYHSSYSPIKNADGVITGVVGVSNDITDLRKYETQMNILSSALEQTADLVLIADVNGIIEYVNPAFEKTTGYQREEVIGKTKNITFRKTRTPVLSAPLGYHSTRRGL